MSLSQNIKDIFNGVLLETFAIGDFENWLYRSEEIEGMIGSDDYLALISLDYQKRGIRYELKPLLEKWIDTGELETRKLLLLLKEAQQKTSRLSHILMIFYDLYCDGYYFLRDLALCYGLAVIDPDPSEAFWDEAKESQSKNRLANFSPKLEEEIARVISWLEKNQIVLTGEKERGYSGYVDYRSAQRS